MCEVGTGILLNPWRERKITKYFIFVFKIFFFHHNLLFVILIEGLLIEAVW